MSDGGVVAAGAAAPREQQQQQQPNFLQTILRFIVMYQAMSFFTKSLGGGTGGGGLISSLLGIAPANQTNPSSAQNDPQQGITEIDGQPIASTWRPAFSKLDHIVSANEMIVKTLYANDVNNCCS